MQARLKVQLSAFMFLQYYIWGSWYASMGAYLRKSVGSTVPVQTALIFGAILLHGVCYDFLFIAGQLYVDDEANERMRGAAQEFIAFILWGVGAFVGTALAGMVMAAHKLPTPVGTIEHDWAGIWMQPAIGAVVVLGVFLIFFREPRRGTP